MIQVLKSENAKNTYEFFGISNERGRNIMDLTKKEWDNFSKIITKKILQPDTNFNTLVDFGEWFIAYIKYAETVQEQAFLIHAATHDAIRMSKLIAKLIQIQKFMIPKLLTDDLLQNNKQDS